MLRKIFSFILLVVMFNFIVGCSSFLNVSLDEVKNKKVSKITLQSDEQLNAENNTIKFYQDKNCFTIRNDKGVVSRISPSQIQLIEIRESRLAGFSDYQLDYKSFLKMSKEVKPNYFHKAILKNGMEITYQDFGALVDFDNNVISGYIYNANKIDTDLNDLDHLQKKKFSFWKTALLVSGLTLFCYSIGTAIADLDFGSGRIGGNIGGEIW